jgi:hypothetical protein
LNITYCINVLKRTLYVLLLAHIPYVLLLLGIEFIPIVLWVGLIENIPLLFLDINNFDSFRVSEFGIRSYSWQGFLISIICKYIVFLLLVLLFDICFKKRDSANR